MVEAVGQGLATDADSIAGPYCFHTCDYVNMGIHACNRAVPLGKLSSRSKLTADSY
jgi:hypothetical protein